MGILYLLTYLTLSLVSPVVSGNIVSTHLLTPLTHIPSGEWEYCTYSPTYPSHLYSWWQVGILYLLTYLSLSLVSLMASGNTIPTHLLIPLTCIPSGEWEYHLYPLTYLSLSLVSLVACENTVPTHLLIPLTHIPDAKWEYSTYSTTYPSHSYPQWQVGILYLLTYLSLSLVSLVASRNTVPTHLLIPLTHIPDAKWEYCTYSPTYPSHSYPWWQVGIL